MFKTLAFALFLGAGSTASAATLHIAARQVGADVVLTGSGAIDLSAIGSTPFVLDFTGAATESEPQFLSSAAGPTDVYFVSDPGFTPLSGAGFSFSATGDQFFLQGLFPPSRNPALGLGAGYASGDAISFVWTVSGTTLGALNLNFGTLGAFDGNTVTLSLAGADVPVPATLGLLAIGAGALVGAARRGRAA